MSVKTLLFQNVGIRQTIFKNTFWLTTAETITRFLNLAIIIYAARILGATEYGKFAFALSFVSFFVIFGDLGLSGITTREFSGEEEKERDYPSILSLKIILSLGAFFIMFIGSFLVTTDPSIRSIIWVLTLFILISGFFNIIYAFLHSRQRMEYDAAAKIFQIILMAAIGFFVLFTSPSSINLSYAYLIANVVSLVVILILFHYFFHPLKLEFKKDIWKKFLKISWPLSLGFVTGWLYIDIDSIMMGLFGQITEIGWYNAASKISLAIIISVSLISRSFYPVLSKFFKESKENLQKAWDYQMKLMIILSIPIMVGGFVLAPKIIHLFYGLENYSFSVLAFRILIFITGISFFYYPYCMILIVSNQQKRSFYLILIGAIINIILNLILIPEYSLYGAAMATVMASIIIFLMAIIMVKRFTPVSSRNLIGVSAMSFFSSLMMLPAIYLLGNIFIIIPASMVIYFSVLYLLQHGKLLQHS